MLDHGKRERPYMQILVKMISDSETGGLYPYLCFIPQSVNDIPRLEEFARACGRDVDFEAMSIPAKGACGGPPSKQYMNFADFIEDGGDGMEDGCRYDVLPVIELSDDMPRG